MRTYRIDSNFYSMTAYQLSGMPSASVLRDHAVILLNDEEYDWRDATFDNLYLSNRKGFVEIETVWSFTQQEIRIWNEHLIPLEAALKILKELSIPQFTVSPFTAVVAGEKVESE